MIRDHVGVDAESLDCVDIAREILEELSRVTDEWEREQLVAAIVHRVRREVRDEREAIGALAEIVQDAVEQALDCMAPDQMPMPMAGHV
jgi:hypothetical protein